jgi:small subunit ribosomal protein S8
MVNDPIGDMIIQIKNAAMAHHHEVELPYSRMKFDVAVILKQEGYLESVEKMGADTKKTLKIALRYANREPVLTDVKRKSKPGLRVYVGKKFIPKVVGGMGIAILSTPQGVMTGKEAQKRGVGGELLCEIW